MFQLCKIQKLVLNSVYVYAVTCCSSKNM